MPIASSPAFMSEVRTVEVRARDRNIIKIANIKAVRGRLRHVFLTNWYMLLLAECGVSNFFTRMEFED